MAILYHSKFKGDPWLDGGNKRSSQIQYLLGKIDSSVIDFSSTSENKSINRLKKYITGIKYLRSHKLPFKSRRNIANYGFKIENEVQNFKNRYKNGIFIWEYSLRTKNNIPFITKASGLPIFAIPHNLESLVLNQKSLFSGKTGLKWLQEEIAILRQCDLTFTISREEEWLLSLMGINVDYLPYYPVPQVENYLLNIRKLRENIHQENYYLWIGTTHNPPTYHGALEIVNFFEKNKGKFKLKVAGFGTESLRKKITNKNSSIEILGSVDNDKLEKLLTFCSAIIINQYPSSGALTKIPEMLIAGIPIIGNNLALRSFYNLSGIHTFHNFDELDFVLNKVELSIPEIPKKDEMSVNRFLNQIQKELH